MWGAASHDACVGRCYEQTTKSGSQTFRKFETLGATAHLVVELYC